MGVTQYIGSRYVPLFADPADWSNAKTYEPLTIVLHEGNSYTSKQFVPKGIDIDNDTYWAETGNYNAQVEQYRQEVARLSDDVDDLLLQGATHIKKYANVAEMQADSSLELGAVCYVDGYYEARDGGACMFLIGANNIGLMPIRLDNGRYAVRTNTSSYNALALGFKRDNASDNHSHMLEILAYSRANNFPQLDIFFPAGCYRFSPTKLQINNLTLHGVGYHTMSNLSFGDWDARLLSSFSGGTVFAAIDNQEYILWLGSDLTADYPDSGRVWCNNSVSNIAFTSIKPNATSDSESKMYSLVNSALIVNNAYMSKFEYLCFMYIYGIGLKQMYGYENDFEHLKFRFVTPYANYNDGAFVLTRNTRQSDGEVISACNYDVLMFEFCYGSSLQILNVGIGDCSFGFISLEDGYRAGYNVSAVEQPDWTGGDNYLTVPIIYVKLDWPYSQLCNICIDKLSLNYPTRFIFTSNNGINYAHDVGISVKESNSPTVVAVNEYMCSASSHRFWYLEGAATNFGPSVKFIVGSIPRKIGSSNLADRDNRRIMRGYATYAKVNDSVIVVDNSGRRRFQGIDASMVGINSARIGASGFEEGPRLMVNPYDMSIGRCATGFGLALNTPNQEGYTILQSAQFVIPTIPAKFLAYLYIPNSGQDANVAKALGPIVDAATTGSVLSELETTFNRIASDYWEVSIDCTNVTTTHVIVILNASDNTNENILLGYEWF